ncbi:MAG: hypothetical protein U0520_04705 [Candidatus Saccharimonadales bacterium]
MASNNFKLGSSKQRRRKRYFVIPLILLLIAGVSFAGLHYQKRFDRETAQKAQSEEIAKNDSSATKAKDGKTQEPSPGIDNPNVDEIPESNLLSVTITSLTQEGAFIEASATIQGSDTQGTCVFSFTSTDSKPVVKQIVSSESSGKQSCAVSVPRVEFDKRGDWSLLLTLYCEGNKTSASQAIMLE